MMKMTLRGILLSALLTLLSIGCSSVVPVPTVPLVTAEEANAAWGRILAKHVDSEGRICFTGVGQDTRDLNTFVRYVAEAKADSFKTPAEKMAFYLNAYNALSMHTVIEKNYPEDIDGFFKRLRFFYSRKYTIQGEQMSLYTFENDVIRKQADPRVHVALNCMSAGCPRLPREAFTGAKLESQLEREAKKFYNETRNVREDEAAREVHISEILKFFTEDFLAKSPTLIDYVNQYRTKKIPKDYKVKFIDYDWTIYRQPQCQKKGT